MVHDVRRKLMSTRAGHARRRSRPKKTNLKVKVVCVLGGGERLFGVLPEAGSLGLAVKNVGS